MKLVRVDAFTTALVPDDDARAEIAAEPLPPSEPQGHEPPPADIGPHPGDKAVKRARKP